MRRAASQAPGSSRGCRRWQGPRLCQPALLKQPFNEIVLLGPRQAPLAAEVVLLPPSPSFQSLQFSGLQDLPKLSAVIIALARASSGSPPPARLSHPHPSLAAPPPPVMATTLACIMAFPTLPPQFVSSSVLERSLGHALLPISTVRIDHSRLGPDG